METGIMAVAAAAVSGWLMEAQTLLQGRYEWRLQHQMLVRVVPSTVRVVPSGHTGGTRLPLVCHTDVPQKRTGHTDTDNSGEQRLPPVSDMKEDIRKKREEMENRFVCSQRHTIQVDYLEFMDELAELLGVKPKNVESFSN
ncbi:unnamed protein product [Ranitomeya imitator]|uniref:Flavin-containing monooxygenase n=1 Tax=Ranitomeya imitator TaxID=111125 RepID=A0ABN9KUN9_9NEOB|nr:unnamed protein product [Ranitomeya imitator]